MNITTRSQAINEMCKVCIYDRLSTGTWKDQVESCTDMNCPLYSFRPLSAGTNKRLKDERYALMSPEEKKKYDARADAARERFKSVREG